MDSANLRFSVRNNRLMRNKFAGIYSISNIPLKLNRNKFYIVNTVDKIRVMGHWVLFIFKKRRLYFIDSFGKNVNFYGGGIKKVYDRYKGFKEHAITFEMQSRDSLVCGAYVFYFAYHICNGENIERIVNRFSKFNKMNNDKSVEKFLYKKSNSSRQCHVLSCPKKMFEKECRIVCKCKFSCR